MAGQYKGKEKHPTVVLEAVADQRLWIWHVFFGTAGALNYINVLDKSLLFDDRIDGTGWDATFEICNRHYRHAYYLVDGIYPQWSTLIKAKSVSQDPPSLHFQKLSGKILRGPLVCSNPAGLSLRFLLDFGLKTWFLSCGLV
jgi:hypothetical protein